MSLRTRKRPGAPSKSNDGFARGWGDGYKIGASEVITRAVSPPAVPGRQVKVLFVRENSTGYHHIESGIIHVLGKSVSGLVVVNNTDPLVEIAARELPDLMLVLNGIFSIQPSTLEAVRALGVRTAVWFADDPYFMELTTRLVPHYDYVFTHEAGVVDYYRSLGGNVQYLPFAANVDRIYPTRVESMYWSDICFIGSAFPNRVAFFDRLVPYLRTKKIFIAGGLWHQLKAYGAMRHSIQLAGVSADDAVKYYNGARIVINLHRQPPGSEANPPPVSALSVNPRTFEINACGTLQLTDVRPDLPSLYTPGKSIVTFATAEECIAKLDHYLHHEHERLELALNGYAATRKAHTYEHRMTLLLATIFGA